ncbi:MAG TPA: ABC transporter permease [Myxococcaceae bacterium]|nr:ABC transporter permease [Myxococcaceae bacterium]
MKGATGWLNPFWQLLLMRLRTFTREPSATFWVFGFPLLMSVALGLAFRNQAGTRLSVAVADGPERAAVVAALGASEGLSPTELTLEEAREALRRGKVALVIVPGPTPRLLLDPTQPDARTARLLAVDALQRAAGRTDPLPLVEERVTVPGTRYIDFLVPGLLGFGLMSSSIWGIGWAIVQMRMGKLLRRLAATPMRKLDFLLAFATARLLLALLEVLFFLGFARLIFDVRVAGNPVTFVVWGLLGALTFGGLSALVASRAQSSETASGLMNLVTLPMTVVSGVFFSSSHFPGWLQPILRALPLTALIDGLRAISIDGAGVAALALPAGVLLVWGAGSFGLALRLFRWT